MNYADPVTPLFSQLPNADESVDRLLSPVPGGVLDSLLQSAGYWALFSRRTPATANITETSISGNVIELNRTDPTLHGIVDRALACP